MATPHEALALKGQKVYLDLGDSIDGGEHVGVLTNLRTSGQIWLDDGRVKIDLDRIIFMEALD